VGHTFSGSEATFQYADRRVAELAIGRAKHLGAHTLNLSWAQTSIPATRKEVRLPPAALDQSNSDCMTPLIAAAGRGRVCTGSCVS
jgi:hypothetical protein